MYVLVHIRLRELVISGRCLVAKGWCLLLCKNLFNVSYRISEVEYIAWPSVLAVNKISCSI